MAIQWYPGHMHKASKEMTEALPQVNLLVPRDGFILPEKHHAQELLDFTNDWDISKPLLVHCHMGISRSTATSLGVAAKYDPENIEIIIEKLKEIAPHASP